MIKQCAICGKEFESDNPRKKYCSRKCQHRAATHRYYRKYKESCLARAKKWREEHREQNLLSMKKWRWRKAVAAD